jgi:hypothetical protein
MVMALCMMTATAFTMYRANDAVSNLVTNGLTALLTFVREFFFQMFSGESVERIPFKAFMRL